MPVNPWLDAYHDFVGDRHNAKTGIFQLPIALAENDSQIVHTFDCQAMNAGNLSFKIVYCLQNYVKAGNPVN